MRVIEALNLTNTQRKEMHAIVEKYKEEHHPPMKRPWEHRPGGPEKDFPRIDGPLKGELAQLICGKENCELASALLQFWGPKNEHRWYDFKDGPLPFDFGGQLEQMRGGRNNKELMDGLLVVLDAAQRTKWDEMIGRPFVIPTSSKSE